MYRSPVSDHGNGTYSAIFSELAVGKYTVFAFLDGKPVEKVVPQNNATIIPGPMDSVASTAVDLNSLETVAGNPGELIVSVRDQYYNPTTYRIHNLTLMLAPQQLNIAGTEIFIAVGWRPQACPCYPPIVPGRKCECHRFRVKRTAIGLEACNLTDTTLAAVAGSKTENSSSVLSALPWIASVRRMAAQLHLQTFTILQAIVPDVGAMGLFQYFRPFHMNPLALALHVLVMQVESHATRDHGWSF
jgi:hypothetical protein